MNLLSEVTKEMDPDAELVTEAYIDDAAAKAAKSKAVSKVSVGVKKENFSPDGYVPMTLFRSYAIADISR
jgi:hypothetical protein